MALYTPEKVVLNWYQYDASFSMELMVSFVSTLEKQANESIAHYTNTRAVAGHEGLDSQTWEFGQHLRGVFSQPAAAFRFSHSVELP